MYDDYSSYDQHDMHTHTYTQWTKQMYVHYIGHCTNNIYITWAGTPSACLNKHVSMATVREMQDSYKILFTSYYLLSTGVEMDKVVVMTIPAEH